MPCERSHNRSRMRRMSYPSHRFKGYYPRRSGIERARQHIREAEEFTRELGGSDQDVKQYFFSLSSEQLRDIFEAYGKQYGWKPRQYAEETIDKWRSGQVRMSGLVAKRLFGLLPLRMPLREKYRLTERLWRHVGPSSRKVLKIGLDAQVDDVVGAVRYHIEQVVTHYTIPDTLERRFQWLSAGDVQVKQELLNYLRQREKELVVDGVREQLPVMLKHLHMDEGGYTHRMVQILKTGKHELELLLDKGASGVRLVDPAPLTTTARAQSVPSEGGFDLGWLWWIVGIGVVLFFLIA